MSDNELITAESVNAMEVFAGGGLDKILAYITAKATELVPDVSTDKGRKEIASMARRVSSSKVLLDGLGKDLVSDWKAKSRMVDASRKAARDTLDALRDATRLPLTEWEEAKKAKEEAEALEKEVSEAFDAAKTENELFDRQKDIEAKEAKLAEEAEAKRLKEEEAEAKRLRLEREELIRKEAADKERLAAQQREIDAKTALEQAEKDRVAAAEKASVDQKNAVKEAERKAKEEAERVYRDRLAAEAEKERQAAALAEDKEHRAKINNAALSCLMGCGLTEEDGKDLIKAIAHGEIAHITINY